MIVERRNITQRDTANRLELRETEVDLDRLRLVRSTTLQLVDGLSDADATVQSMTDASPAKWHIGHTTWFFEAVVLNPYVAGYQTFDNSFHFIFNSYYEALSPRHLRHRRGMLTRPSLERVIAYRAHVDEALDDFMSAEDVSEEVWDLIELGMNHEQQPQELLLTDILHLFLENPLRP